MPRVVSNLKVVHTMLSAGFIPRAPYPGATTPWPCQHTTCGENITVIWNAVQQGKGTHSACPAAGIGSWSSAKRWIRKNADNDCACGEPRWAWTHDGGCSEQRTDGKKTWCEHTEHWEAKCRSCALAGQTGCSVDECDRSHYMKGWCRAHHRRWAKTGDVQADRPVRDQPEELASDDGKTAWMRSVGLEPLEIYPGAHKPWRCLHVECEQEITVRYSDTKRKGRARCPHCAGNCARDCGCSVRTGRAA